MEPLMNFYRTSTELLPNLNQTSIELLLKHSQNLSQSCKKIHLKCNYFEPFFQPTVNSFLRRFPLHKLPIMWRRCKSFTLKKWPKAASAAAPQHSPVIYIFPKQFAVLLYPFLRQNGISKKHLMVSTKRRKKLYSLELVFFAGRTKFFFARHLKKI